LPPEAHIVTKEAINLPQHTKDNKHTEKLAVKKIFKAYQLRIIIIEVRMAEKFVRLVEVLMNECILGYLRIRPALA
jgi:hypothetical protein